MKNFFKKAYYGWRYYLHTPEEYKVCMEEDFQNNLFGISLTTTWFAIFAAVNVIVNFSLGANQTALFFSATCVVGVALAVFAWIRYEKSKKGVHTHKIVIYALSFLLFAIMMGIAFYFDILISVNTPSVYFLLFIVAGLFFINFSPQFSIVLALITTGIFILSVVLFKHPSVWFRDISNISMFVPAAITFNWFVCLQKMTASNKKINLEKIVKTRTQSLENSEAELRQAYNAIIMGMSMLSESRDGVTGAHLTRVKAQTSLLTHEIAKNHPEKLSPEMVERIVSYSPLHDVGKVGVPDAVLNKTGGLTSEEFEQMKLHTTNGAALLLDILQLLPNDSGYLGTAQEIAENHHERFDGTGYPHGLSGEQIPLSARIVALADIYDALRSPRAYKPAFTHEQAFDIITKGDGRTSPAHFDPIVIEAFKKVHEEMSAAYDDNADK